jgi:hypothetical protein
MFNFITKKWFLENKTLVYLAAASIIFFIVCSFFYPLFSEKFNSPDETANYFFIKLFSKDGELRFPEPLNFIGENQIHPRSATVVNGYIVPGGFLGLILIYGAFAKVFGIKIFYFLAPFFLVLAAFCFYKIVENIFGKSTAMISSLLFLSHPAILYYSARGLFPNILFVSLLIISLYFLIRRPLKNISSYLDFISSGIFLGLTVMTRPSEIIWIGFIYALLFIFYRKSADYKEIILFIVFFFLSLSPLFLYNFLIYNNFFGAYNVGTISGDSQISNTSNWFFEAGKYIFPFGIHPKNILKVFAGYFAGIFWWLSIPAALAAIYFIKKAVYKRMNKEVLVYLISCVAVSFFLFIYYGSWIFSDNQTKAVSIGTSYIRYWLPIYIFVLPLIAYFFQNIVGFFGEKKKRPIIVFFALVLFLFSFKSVLFDSKDGLIKIYYDTKKTENIFYEVNKLVEQEAIIIVDRADKIFFPEFRVTYPLRDDKTYRLIPKLVESAPLYYYGITLPEKDVNYLNEEKFKDTNVKIIFIKNFGQESLYKLIR